MILKLNKVFEREQSYKKKIYYIKHPLGSNIIKLSINRFKDDLIELSQLFEVAFLC